MHIILPSFFNLFEPPRLHSRCQYNHIRHRRISTLLFIRYTHAQVIMFTPLGSGSSFFERWIFISFPLQLLPHQTVVRLWSSHLFLISRFYELEDFSNFGDLDRRWVSILHRITNELIFPFDAVNLASNLPSRFNSLLHPIHSELVTYCSRAYEPMLSKIATVLPCYLSESNWGTQ